MAAREDYIRSSMSFLYGLIQNLLLPAKSNREYLIAGVPRFDLWTEGLEEDQNKKTVAAAATADASERSLDEEESQYNDDIVFEEPEEGEVAQNDRANQVWLFKSVFSNTDCW